MREIEELEGRNTRRFFGAIVGFAVIAAAVGLLFRSNGIGADEQDHSILIVADQTWGFEHYTAELGFDSITGTLADWQAELSKDGSREAAEIGLPDILEFADLSGYGYVVIENPQRFAEEIAQLELGDGADGALGEAHYAVLSIGDFADPHQLSIDPPLPPGIDLGPGPRMLTALFAQPRLAQVLVPNAAASDIQTARLKLDKAIETFEQIARHEQRATKMLHELEAELASFTSPSHDDDEHRARLLHEPLAGASAYPLRDGRVVLRSDRLRFNIDADLELRSSAEFWLHVIPADASSSADASVACPELLDGGGPRGSISTMQLSADLDALFVRHGDEGTLFELDPAAGPCGLREVASLSIPQPDSSYVAVTRRAIAMRHVDELGVLHIDVRPVAADQPPSSVTVSAPEFQATSSLVWLDDRHLANLVDLAEGQQPALVILDLDRVEAPLVVPLQPPEADDDVVGHELARIPGSDRALLLRWSVGNHYNLARLDFDRPWTELIDGAATIGWTPVTSVDGHMRGFDIDPQARAVAFTYEGDVGVDVGLAALPSPGGRIGPTQVILDDAHEHRDVSFRPHHDELLFRTRIRLERPEASLLVVHAIGTKIPG